MSKLFEICDCLFYVERFTPEEQKAYRVMTFKELPDEGKTYSDYVVVYTHICTILELTAALFKAWSTFHNGDFMAKLDVSLSSTYDIYISSTNNNNLCILGENEIKGLLDGPFKEEARQVRKNAIISFLGNPDVDIDCTIWKDITIFRETI